MGGDTIDCDLEFVTLDITSLTDTIVSVIEKQHFMCIRKN